MTLPTLHHQQYDCQVLKLLKRRQLFIKFSGMRTDESLDDSWTVFRYRSVIKPSTKKWFSGFSSVIFFNPLTSTFVLKRVFDLVFYLCPRILHRMIYIACRRGENTILGDLTKTLVRNTAHSRKISTILLNQGIIVSRFKSEKTFSQYHHPKTRVLKKVSKKTVKHPLNNHHSISIIRGCFLSRFQRFQESHFCRDFWVFSKNWQSHQKLVE